VRYVIGATAIWTDASPSESRGEHCNVNVQQDCGDCAATGGEGCIERRSLRRIAREAVKDHALRSVRLSKSRADHADRHLIRDELPCVNE
jgi:hypothetical protein